MLISIILKFIFDFQSYHVNVTEAGTLGRIVRNLPAVVLYHVTSPVSSIGPSDFHLFEHLKKHLAGKRFAAHTEVMQAVTSMLTDTRHLCLLHRNSNVGSRWDKCLNVNGTQLKSGVYHLLPMCNVLKAVKISCTVLECL